VLKNADLASPMLAPSVRVTELPLKVEPPLAVYPTPLLNPRIPANIGATLAKTVITANRAANTGIIFVLIRFSN
jgi:hypothetical protein